MKKHFYTDRSRIFLMLFFSHLIFAALSTVGAFAQSVAEDRLPRWDFGFVRVITLQDSAGEFPAALFPKASREQIEKYMPGGKAPSSVSTYLLRIPEKTEDGNTGRFRNILFDTGNGNDRSELFSRLQRDKIPTEEIDEIYLTHMHGDHIGGLLQDGKRVFSKAKVYSVKEEYDYWCPDQGEARNATLPAIKKAYGKDFTGRLRFGETITVETDSQSEQDIPCRITVLDAVGHTPGHACFLLESADRKLMIIGDLLHAAALQFPVPELCPKYDQDPEKAVASRKRILDQAAREQIPVAGMHLPAPGFGYVRINPEGGYVFQPGNQHFSSDP